MKNKDSEELVAALDAERVTLNGRSGPLSCYVAGEGPPMLLVHSINAAGSAYEIRPIFERYVGSHRVFAPDLPGFGFSDRSDRDYTVQLYVDAILDVMDLIARDGDERVDALALSLSSEFLARAATLAPDRFRSLALVTPTGFRAGSDELREAEGATAESGWLSAMLSAPFIGRGLFRLLVTRGSIRFFLKRTFGSERIDEGLAEYSDLTTHQPGAEHAPFAFLSGKLFSKDIRNVYERLALPVWLAHGTRGSFSDFAGADWTRDRANWQVDSFSTGALPHFEQPAEFFARYDRFLDRAGTHLSAPMR